MTPKTARDETSLKDASQERQKEMIGAHFSRLARSGETGEKSVYTFVPGNLTELVRSFDLLPVLPEIKPKPIHYRALKQLYKKVTGKADRMAYWAWLIN